MAQSKKLLRIYKELLKIKSDMDKQNLYGWSQIDRDLDSVVNFVVHYIDNQEPHFND